jgi:methyltransferase (TIGR00027 family)
MDHAAQVDEKRSDKQSRIDMALPNLSNLMYVAHLRYVQTIHEPPERRNPDTMAGQFIPMLRRFRTAWLGLEELSRLRSDPFYYYLVARTRYYDEVVRNAIADGVQRLVMVGCGSDTRSYRFKDLLRRKGIKVLECDQLEAINEKKRLTRRWSHSGHMEYLAVDLNEGEWPELEHWLGEEKTITLVMLEGVSPYIHDSAFNRFLRLLATRLAVGSPVAYDFKISGVNDDWGRTGRTAKPFRLSTSKDEVTALHKAIGLQLDHMELSSDLVKRLLPNLGGYPRFEEDGLLRLRVTVA